MIQPSTTISQKKNKLQPPSLLLSLSRSSLLMCSLRGPTRPAGGSRRHLQWNAHQPIPSPSFWTRDIFTTVESLILFLLKMWTAPSRDSSDCSSSPSDQCSILVAFCDISWICGCIYTELLFLSWIMLCLLPFHFFFFTLGVSRHRTPPLHPFPPTLCCSWEPFFLHHFNYLKIHVLRKKKKHFICTLVACCKLTVWNTIARYSPDRQQGGFRSLCGWLSMALEIHRKSFLYFVVRFLGTPDTDWLCTLYSRVLTCFSLSLFDTHTQTQTHTTKNVTFPLEKHGRTKVPNPPKHNQLKL